MSCDHIPWCQWKRINPNQEVLLETLPSPNVVPSTKPWYTLNFFLGESSFVKYWMGSRTIPAPTEAGRWNMWLKSDMHSRTCRLKGLTLFNMAAAGSRVHWMVKIGFAAAPEYLRLLLWCVFGMFFPLLGSQGYFLKLILYPSSRFCEHHILPVNKLSKDCFCRRYCSSLSKFPFESEGFLFSAVERAAGRQHSVISPPQNCRSWRASLPKVIPFSLGHLNPEMSQHGAERPCRSPQLKWDCQIK